MRERRAAWFGAAPDQAPPARLRLSRGGQLCCTTMAAHKAAQLSTQRSAHSALRRYPSPADQTATATATAVHLLRGSTVARMFLRICRSAALWRARNWRSSSIGTSPLRMVCRRRGQGRQGRWC